MKIKDRVYGKNEINEPVLLELIASKPLQRIKEVNQAGTQLVEPYRTNTRYDHCVGVMLLLRRFGASFEEQIAGLLHDVPHTAFSHAADFVFKENETQTYHERFLKKIINSSEIPTILTKYGFSVNVVTDESNFSLLEQPIPRLCADRIDYILRDLLIDKVYSPEKIDQILDNLDVFDGQFVVKDKEVALSFARDFMKQTSTYYNAPKTLTIFELMGELIRTAFASKVLTESDLFTTDTQVIAKIRASKNLKIQELLKQLTPDLKIEFNNEDFDFDTRGKARYIDPFILEKNKLTKTSEIFPKLKTEIEDFIEKTKIGHKIKLSRI